MEIHPTAIIGDGVVLGEGTRVGPYVQIEDGVVLGKDNVLWTRAFIGRGTTLGDGNHVHPGATIGHLPQDISFDPDTPTFTKIGSRNHFREFSSIHRASKEGEATVIGDECMFMAQAHVAHDCKVGSNVVLVNQSVVAGHCEIGDKVILSGLTTIHQFCRIGRFAFLSGLSGTNKDMPPFFIFGGRPCLAEAVNRVGLRRGGISRESQKEIKEAYRLLYRSDMTIGEATHEIEANLTCAEAKELALFIRSSKRGIALGTKDDVDGLSTKRNRSRAGGRGSSDGGG